MKHKLDQKALEAAKAYLLGRASPPQSGEAAATAKAKTAQSSVTVSVAALPEPSFSEPAGLELSAADIRRTASGWRARCIHKRGVDSRHVQDARYGGYIKSFLQAIDTRDQFYRARGMPIPWQIEAIVDGVRVAPEVARSGRKLLVQWQGQEHVVTGTDAEEIATEIALDLFVEYLNGLQLRAAKDSA